MLCQPAAIKMATEFFPCARDPANMAVTSYARYHCRTSKLERPGLSTSLGPTRWPEEQHMPPHIYDAVQVHASR